MSRTANTIEEARHRIALSRAVWRFSVGKANPIEEVTSTVSKVTCFTVHIGGSGVPAPEREHYRGWWHLACQFTRGSGDFFSDVLRLRAVALFICASMGIYYVSERPFGQLC